MTNDTLERFQPSKLPVESGKEIELPVETVSEDEALKALERMGHVKLPKKALSDLASIGVYQTGVGVFKIQRGQAMVNQVRLNGTMDIIYGIIADGIAKGSIKASPRKKKKAVLAEQVVQLAHTLGYLSSKLTESQHLLLEMEQSRPGGVHDDEPKQQASFAAGEEIKPGARIVAQTVHIHEAGSNAPAETSKEG